MQKERRSRSAAMAVMWIVSTLELLSLTVIVANKFSAHLPVVTSTGGPLHGVLYVSTIALALMLPLPRSSKWLALIPAVGGLLSLWWAGRGASHPAVPPQAAFQTDEPSNGAAIVADQVTASVPGLHPVGPLSFAVPRGTIVLLTGSNEAGRSILLRLMCGLVARSSGRIEVATAHHGAARSSGVGVLIDAPALLPNLTVRENLLVVTRLLGRKASVADRALERVDMTNRADRRVDALSPGMKQRVGIAAALLGDPDVIVLDEPTNGLDQQGKTDVRALLCALRSEGRTIILASHDVEDFADLCDSLIVMKQGRIAFHGTPGDLRASSTAKIRYRAKVRSGVAPQTTAAFVRAGHAARQEGEAILIWAGPDDHEALMQIAPTAHVVPAGNALEQPTLEEALMRLTASADARPCTAESTVEASA